jgi:hypothetical protein
MNPTKNATVTPKQKFRRLGELSSSLDTKATEEGFSWGCRNQTQADYLRGMSRKSMEYHCFGDYARPRAFVCQRPPQRSSAQSCWCY